MEGKKIEELYIQYNNFKIIHGPILFDLTQPLKRIAERNAKKWASFWCQEFYFGRFVTENMRSCIC